MIVAIDRGDLSALVELLAHEAFSYNARGMAALRAYRQLEHAIETNAITITLAPLESSNGGNPHGENVK